MTDSGSGTPPERPPERPSDAWAQPQGVSPAAPPPPPPPPTPGTQPPPSGSGSPYAAPPTWTPASAAYGPQKTNPTAIVSLIAGIANFVFCPLIGSIVAIITGHVASSQIKRSSGTQGGKGLAKAGLILGYIGLALTILGIVGVVIAFTVFGDDITRAALRDDARDFVETARDEASAEGTELRDSTTLATAYRFTDFDTSTFDSMVLANGVSLTGAIAPVTQADWEASNWQVQLNGSGIQDAEVCLTIPDANIDAVITNGPCAPVSAR